MKLKNFKVIITGGSTGLGFAFKKRFIKEGALVVDWSRGWGFDVTKKLPVVKDIDVLICNAGIVGSIGPLESASLKDWKRAIDVNLFGVVNCVKAVLPAMIKQKHGSIIIVSGGGATRAIPTISSYCAAKTAVVRFAETLALEVHKHGIDVNCISPGLLPTDIHDFASRSPLCDPNYKQEIAKAKKLTSKAFIAPCDLAVWLAGNESIGVTGRLISAVWDDYRLLNSNTPKNQFTLTRQL